MTTVLVVEDQQALASALEIAIGTQPGLECVGSTGTVEDALSRASARVPDVVLMDVELPGADGIEGTRRIKTAHPATRVLILTARATPQRLAEATAAGADGFLTKDTPLPEILAAIRYPTGQKMVVEGSTFRQLLAEVGAAEGAGTRRAASPETMPANPETQSFRLRSRELAERSQQLAERAGALADETGRLAQRTSRLTGRSGALPRGSQLTAREQEVLALMGEGLDPRAISESLFVSVHTARGYVKSILTKLGVHSQLEAVVLATKAGLLPAAPNASSLPPGGDAPRDGATTDDAPRDSAPDGDPGADPGADPDDSKPDADTVTSGDPLESANKEYSHQSGHPVDPPSS